MVMDVVLALAYIQPLIYRFYGRSIAVDSEYSLLILGRPFFSS